MEIVGLVSTILLALVLVIIAQRMIGNWEKIPLFSKIWNRFKKKKPDQGEEPPLRMFVAVRRHPVGRAEMMKMEDEEYETKKKSVLSQMDDLVKQWSTVATFKWGFHGSEYGLPSSNDENWMLFASFVVPNHEIYRLCLDMMQAETFLPLRNQCDIRLAYGEKMETLPQTTIELFRQGFSR